MASMVRTNPRRKVTIRKLDDPQAALTAACIARTIGLRLQMALGFRYSQSGPSQIHWKCRKRGEVRRTARRLLGQARLHSTPASRTSTSRAHSASTDPSSSASPTLSGSARATSRHPNPSTRLALARKEMAATPEESDLRVHTRRLRSFAEAREWRQFLGEIARAASVRESGGPQRPCGAVAGLDGNPARAGSRSCVATSHRRRCPSCARMAVSSRGGGGPTGTSPS